MTSNRPQVAPGGAYAWYVLFILFLGNAFNAMDRSIIMILVEPIRQDLRLNDTQMGVVTGLAYAVVYGLFSIPVARVVDQGNRKSLLAGGVAFWSLMTALTGQVGGFATLMLARVGVAAGESTCIPTSLSIISDYFDRSRRPRAIAVFQLGTYVGMIAGAVLASLIAARYGWRDAFHFLGWPGLALAVLVMFTIREPKRGQSDAAPMTGAPRTGGAVAAMRLLLRDHPQFALLLITAIFMSLSQVTMSSWVAAFFMRVHGVSQEDVGVMAGPIVGLGGVFGTLVGGFVGTWLARREGTDRAPLKVLLVSAPLAIPAILTFLFAPSLTVSLIAGSTAAFLLAAHFGPLVAVAISSVGGHERGSASSLLVIGQFLIGFGLGPLFVGGVSDLLEPATGATSLRYALLLAPVCVIVAVAFVTLAYRRLAQTDSPPA